MVTEDEARGDTRKLSHVDQIEMCIVSSQAGSIVEVQTQQYNLGRWLSKTGETASRKSRE
jgi:hypothetical protein